MSYDITYKTILKVNILHNYFLNKGTTSYLSMSEKDKKKQMDNYNISNFISVVPTQETLNIMKGHRLLFRQLQDGFSVLSEVSSSNKQTPTFSLEDDLTFSFILKITDYRFLNYTKLELDSAKKLFYFTNYKLYEKSDHPYLRKSGDNSPITKSYILSADDAAEYVLPLLTISEKVNLFGLVSLRMKSPETDLSITNSSIELPVSETVFEIVMENRKTIWRYIFESDQTPDDSDDVKKEGTDKKILKTKEEQPLTSTGFIPLTLNGNKLPNSDANMIKPGSDNKIYSEIYM